MVQIGHLELFVRDPLASREFYERVLGFQTLSVQGDGQFVWVRLGSAEILLRRGANTAPTPSYREAPSAIVLYTDNVSRTVEELTARGLQFRGDDGGPEFPTFTDPDGHWFQLACPAP